MNPRRIATMLVMLMGFAGIGAADTPEPEATWQDIIRATPYWVSQGVFSNIVTIRRWVLAESGYCSDQDRHILYGLRGKFLGYIEDGQSRAETQQRLNDTRARLASQDRVEAWTPGDEGMVGYPFALACDQPHVNLNEALARFLGTLPGERVWGTWDDLSLGSASEPLPLHDALMHIYSTRKQQQRLDLPPELPRYLAGQLLIESGGQTRAHSAAGARGIMQLLPSVLTDCGVPERNHWHRMAQIDCALKLMHQNARNLRPEFQDRFGALPNDKRDRLFTLLLIQAYHGGLGRVRTLLADETLSAPAQYFAEHQQRFSAGDIAFGLIFHNLGRDRFGLASLYYLADVELATEAICNAPAMNEKALCQ
ncbi:transglycosylase SLT domain-containing protein [Marinobacter salicampi]|uniref:transglycosylase SLT domain-containing protein n=1 Tax=Marinobacter salicampi TaxID=435907 RepID=UPI0014087C15|nr:transglycosylase SLT domain-containing protein [Marinobacter salicampi]